MNEEHLETGAQGSSYDERDIYPQNSLMIPKNENAAENAITYRRSNYSINNSPMDTQMTTYETKDYRAKEISQEFLRLEE